MDMKEIVQRIAPRYVRDFPSAFGVLKKAVGGSPERLEWAIKNDPATLQKAWRIYHAANWIDSFGEIGNKVFTAPAGFLDCWNEFDEHYRHAVTRSIFYGINQKDGVEIIVTFSAIEWLLSGGEGKPFPSDADEWTDPDYHYDLWVRDNCQDSDPPEEFFGDEFIPAFHDPAEIIEAAVHYFAEQDWKAEENDYFEKAKRAVGAWTYMKDVFGLDAKEIWRRWNLVPVVAQPMGQGRGSQHHSVIADLYREASRCFVFGLFGPGLAMCRALLEEVLGRLYRVHADNLEQVVALAEERYEQIRKWKLRNLKNAANTLLHDYGNRKGHAEEAIVLNFLQTLKGLIEEARASV